MLKRKDVDIVIITTPSGNHMEPPSPPRSRQARSVEKPMEITLNAATASSMLATDKVTLHDLPSRFGDANRELKAAVSRPLR